MSGWFFLIAVGVIIALLVYFKEKVAKVARASGHLLSKLPKAKKEGPAGHHPAKGHGDDGDKPKGPLWLLVLQGTAALVIAVLGLMFTSAFFQAEIPALLAKVRHNGETALVAVPPPVPPALECYTGPTNVQYGTLKVLEPGESVRFKYRPRSVIVPVPSAGQLEVLLELSRAKLDRNGGYYAQLATATNVSSETIDFGCLY